MSLSREEIIRMALDSGYLNLSPEQRGLELAELERFASAAYAAGAAAERNRADNDAVEAINLVLRIVDNMGEMRQQLCEESIKELDRRLMEIRSRISAAETLEEKLAMMKDQREMERIRMERRKRLFSLMDDGAIYAHDPLPRDELLALVAPLREASQPSDPEEIEVRSERRTD